MQRPFPTPSPQESQLAGVLHRNIDAVMKRQSEEAGSRKPSERIADAVTRFTGSMTFVYLHLALFGTWIIINLPIVPLPKFDPTYVVLAMWASVEAIFLSTFVLISQNRMAAVADKRADLNLQISLLSEHEVTRLIHLVSEIAKRLEIEGGHAPELEELKKDVQPEQVLDSLETKKQQAAELASPT